MNFVLQLTNAFIVSFSPFPALHETPFVLMDLAAVATTASTPEYATVLKSTDFVAFINSRLEMALERLVAFPSFIRLLWLLQLHE